MNATRRRLVVVTAVALVLAVVAAVYLDREQLLFGPATDVSIQPRFVSPVGDGGDPLVVMVGFTWTETGYCYGQFHVKANESTTQVRVGPVISRTYSRGACAGLGTDGKLAWTNMTLVSPIGRRAVVRDSDGVALPVFAPSALLACQGAIASEAEPPAYQTVLLNQVGLPRTALQASPSGEADPSARLFAKAGLDVASGASFELSVPDEWVGRLTIGWGGPATRTSNFYVSGCNATAPQERWLVFPGGFWVGEPACAPLLVRSGAQEQVVQIGIGTACPGQAAPPPGTRPARRPGG
jgi:hypothetical protein